MEFNGNTKVNMRQKKKKKYPRLQRNISLKQPPKFSISLFYNIIRYYIFTLNIIDVKEYKSKC